MVLQGCSEPVDCIEGRRCNVIERPPVIRDEVSSFQSLEEGEGIGAGQMTFAKARLPPRSVSDGEKRQVQIPPTGNQMILHEARCIRG